MARHREYRTFNRDEHEFSDDDYGHSYDDHEPFGVSPTTREMYTYRSEGRNIFSEHIPASDYTIDELEFELQSEEPPPPAPDPDPPKKGHPTSAAISIGASSAPIAIAIDSTDDQTPKPQRQPRSNRRSRAHEVTHPKPAVEADLSFNFDRLDLAAAGPTRAVARRSPPARSPVSAIRPKDFCAGRRQSSPALRNTSSGDVAAFGTKGARGSMGRSGLTADASPLVSGTRTPNSLKSNSAGPARTPAGSATPGDFEKKSKLLSARVQEASKQRHSSTKPAINLVVVGHVDAGKSTLMGHVLHIIEPSCETRNMRSGPQEEERAIPYAWNLDETEAERDRGVTIDVAQTCFETEHRRVVLLDAPGHKDFIPNMISGAAQADVVLLVVNATRGEFETGFESGGQTREHAMLVRSFGVSQILVAVNKMDTVNWSKERYDAIVKKSRPFLKQTVRFTSITYVPVSGLLGCNLIERPNPEAVPELTSWYDGPCLLECINQFEPPNRAIDKPFRFCVSDVFRMPNSPGITVAGIVVAGGAFVGTRVLCKPAGSLATIKAVTVTSLNEKADDGAFAGDCCSFVLTGVDLTVMSMGDVLCDPAYPIPCTNLIQARILLLTKDVCIQRGASMMFHHQNISETAIVSRFLGLVDRTKGELISARPPRVLNQACCADVEIRLAKSVCLELYKDFKELGRFTLRHAGKSVASGTVTKLTLEGGIVIG